MTTGARPATGTPGMSQFSLGRLWQLVQKELRQTLRDPRSRPMLLIGPVFQLLIFGYAVNTDVRHVPMYVLDQDGTAESRQLVDALTATGYFDIKGRGARPADVTDALNHGRVVMAIDVPLGFARKLAQGGPAPVQLLVDGSTANTANVALGYANQIITRYALERGATAAVRAGAVASAPIPIAPIVPTETSPTSASSATASGASGAAIVTTPVSAPPPPATSASAGGAVNRSSSDTGAAASASPTVSASQTGQSSRQPSLDSASSAIGAARSSSQTAGGGGDTMPTLPATAAPATGSPPAGSSVAPSATPGAGQQGTPRAPLDFRVRAWYNPNLESRVYNVPAVMGNIVMMMSLLLTALAVVREREIGTLEQLMVSPLRPAELILGKTLPAALIAFVDMILTTAIALLWFQIPFRGSFLVLAVASLLFILTGLGSGLLISTVSATQQEAFMTMFLFFLPAMMLSGMMFPVENMPMALQQLTLLNPIRHYLIVVRGVFLRGAGWTILMPQLLALLVIGVTVLAFATTRFKKTAA